MKNRSVSKRFLENVNDIIRINALSCQLCDQMHGCCCELEVTFLSQYYNITVDLGMASSLADYLGRHEANMAVFKSSYCSSLCSIIILTFVP